MNVYSTDCLPIASGGFSKSKYGYSVYGSMWVNITLGIKDLNVFDKPANCKGFTRGIVNQVCYFDIQQYRGIIQFS